MKNSGDNRQADSDDAILDRLSSKLESLEKILSGDGAAAGSNETIPGTSQARAEKLGNALLADGEAVHFVSAALEQAKLKLGKLCKCFGR